MGVQQKALAKTPLCTTAAKRPLVLHSDGSAIFVYLIHVKYLILRLSFEIVHRYTLYAQRQKGGQQACVLTYKCEPQAKSLAIWETVSATFPTPLIPIFTVFKALVTPVINDAND